jgi:hypothetical protein
MDRRSFLISLLGGMAAAGLGGAAVAQAAAPVTAPEPAALPAGGSDEPVSEAMAEGLDKADTEFSQYYYYRRRPRYYARPRYYRPRYYRPRAYYRPRYYARPRYYRRYRRW